MDDSSSGRRPAGDRRSGGELGFEHTRDPFRSAADLSGSFFLDKSVPRHLRSPAGLRRRVLRLVHEKESMKAMSTEDTIGKVAALCCRALFEFLGHLVELLFRALTALVGKMRAFLISRREVRNKDNEPKKGGERKWFPY